MTPAVLALLASLEAAFAGFRLTAQQAAFWAEALDGYTADQLAYAARMLVAHHAYGAPNLPHVHEAIRGRVRVEHVPVRSLWGGVALRSDGTPRTEPVEVRVGIDGEEIPDHVLRPALQAGARRKELGP